MFEYFLPWEAFRNINYLVAILVLFSVFFVLCIMYLRKKYQITRRDKRIEPPNVMLER